MPAPNSVDKKLDLILKQLDEIRRDVNQLKGRFEGKKPENIQLWQVVPKEKKPGVIELELVPGAAPKPPVPPPPGTKPIPVQPPNLDGLKFKFHLAPGADLDKVDPETRKKLDELLKLLEQKKAANPNLPRIHLDEKKVVIIRKTNESPVPVPATPAPVDLERRLERLLQEAAELRLQIEKAKGGR
jgi:hypothetical protein